MSILINGMEMPTKENAVILITPSGDVWMIGDMPNEDTHLVKAKAVPVPPHGRLGDLDALDTRVEQHYKHKKITRYDRDLLLHYLDVEMARTIIPAAPFNEEVNE